MKREHETQGALRRVAAVLAEIDARGGAAEGVAEAVARHLVGMAPSSLVTAAETHWRAAARLLRAPADRPVTDAAAAAIKSWPAGRAAELVAHLRQVHAALEKAENERLEDEIRDNIRRHYL